MKNVSLNLERLLIFVGSTKGIRLADLYKRQRSAAFSLQVHMLKEQLAAVEEGLRRRNVPEELRPMPHIRVFTLPGEAGSQTLAEYVEMLAKLLD